MNKEILQKYIKDPKKLIMPGFVVFILVVGGLLSSSASAKKQKMKQEYDLVEQQIDGQRRKMLDVPSRDKIDRLKQKYKLMEDIYKKTLLNWKARQKEYSPLRPLQFKEELLTNQQKLETMAGGYEFPRGFGFIEYLEGQIPREEDLPELTKELYFMYEIMRVLYKNNVDKITEIKRLGQEVTIYKEDITFSKKKNRGKAFCKVFSVKFEAESRFLDFMEAFREIAYEQPNYFVIIRNFDFEKIDKETVKASFILRYIEFI